MNMPFGLTIFFGSLTVWAGLLIWGLTHKKFTPFIVFGIAFLLFMNVRYLIEGAPARKLPHQVDNSKLEIPVLNVLGMNSMGVLSPRESWGLNSL